MKIPEIALKVTMCGRLELSDEFGQISCPYDQSEGWAHPCGSWCPHFEANAIQAEGHAEHAHVRLTCGQGKVFDGLRVVEPEGTAGT